MEKQHISQKSNEKHKSEDGFKKNVAWSTVRAIIKNLKACGT